MYFPIHGYFFSATSTLIDLPFNSTSVGVISMSIYRFKIGRPLERG